MRPGDLPALRLSLAAALQMGLWPEEGEALARRVQIGGLMAAELAWVAPAMGRLASVAAASLPAFTVEEWDLIFPHGLVVFAQAVPCEGVTLGGGRGVALRAFSFSIHGGWVHLFAYTDAVSAAEGARSGHERRLAKTGPALVALPGCSLSLALGSGSVAGKPLAALALTVLLLMHQPLARVSPATEGEPNGWPSPAPTEAVAVRVIDLRAACGENTRGGDREYHHSWIVRGHWRQQYHPSRDTHRPVWIAAHLKGDPSKPLLGGEKIYAWRR